MRVCLVILLLLGSNLASLAAQGRVGFGKVDITPSFQVKMGGYGDRTSAQAGAHDRLWARAAVFAVGERRACVVGVDILLINAELAQAIKAEVTRLTGIPTEAVLLCASHTHAGPWEYATDLTPDPSRVDARLREHLRSRIPMAVLAANRALRPAEIGFASREVVGFNHNRRSDQDPLDRSLSLLVARAPGGGKVLGGVVNFTAHPVIMGGNNLQLSAEWPGAAMTALEQQVGGASVFVFLQGCCGDVSIDRKGSTWEEVGRVGEELAALAAGLIPAPGDCQPLSALGWAQARTRVPAKPRYDREAGARLIAQLTREYEQAKQADPQAPAVAELARRLENAHLDAELLPVFETFPRCRGDQIEMQAAAVRVNDCTIVGLGSEAFNRLGLDVKAALPGGRTMVAGYCNDYIGYVPTREAYPVGGYEVAMNRLAPGAGEALAALGIRAAREAARRAR